MAAEQYVAPEAIAERRMCTAVIVHAVEEWLSGPLRVRRAAQFLFEDDDNFFQVCACAGLDPASFRSRLLRVGRRVAMQGSLAQPVSAQAAPSAFAPLAA